MSFEKKTTLWTLGISPLAWSLHLLICYITAAVWCAKYGRNSTVSEIKTVFIISTIVFLIPVVYQMIKGYKQHRRGDESLPHNDDTPEDRERFLGFANFLISGLSVVAILFISYNGLVFRSCH